MKTFMPAKDLWAVVCAVSALVFTFALSALAHDLKIGVVDLQKFGSKSVKAQAMQKKLTSLMNSEWPHPLSPLANKKKELEALQDKLQALGPMVSAETWCKWMEEIRIKEREVNRLIEEESLGRASDPPRAEKIPPGDLAKAAFSRRELGTRWLPRSDMVRTIERIRRQRGLLMVLDQTGILSADDALDITDEVIKPYDAEPDRKATAPAAAP